MRNLYKAVLTGLFILGFVRLAPAQDIATDSKGKGVFTYFSTNKARVDFTSKDFSFTLSTKPKKITYIPTVPSKRVVASRDTLNPSKEEKFTTLNEINVKKRSTYYGQLTILNATDLINVSELENFRPGVRTRLGYQRIVDSIYTRWPGRALAYGGNIFGAVDNIQLYDTDKNSIGKRYPGSVGLEGNVTWFPPEWLARERRWFVLSANSSLSYGWNDDALLNYKELSAATLQPTVVAFNKFDGKYGKLETGIAKWRLSLSAPMSFGYFNPILYAVVTTTTVNKPTYFAGLYSNLLAKPIKFRGFKPPTSFGVGFDWRYNDGEWSSINVFVRGNITLGQF
jgi:hypothetical protein